MPGWRWAAKTIDGQQYEQAAEAFAKVDKKDADGLEAGYYRGLSLLFSGNYANAEKAFADVARILPLAEVVNNEGVAVSRQGHDGTELFIQAAADDPSSADYHFNLAVSLKRHGQVPGAAERVGPVPQAAPQRRRGAANAGGVEAAGGEASAAPASAAPGAAADPAPDPLERIVRTFDAAAFRQAAQMLDQVDAARLAALTPLDQARKLAAQAKGFLDRGLLLEAERLYQLAVAADSNCAEAHAGLAQVRERSGDADAARMEAHQALELRPTADAYLVLGRLDLASNHLSEAGSDAAAALKLEPASQAAQELNRQVEAKARH